MPSRRRSYFIVPLFIAICSIAAGILASPDASAATAATGEDAVSQSLKSFTQIYDAVERNFADPVKPDVAIYNGAIPGMLHTLDPHSNFFDPKTYAQMREEQRGHYFGIGMSVRLDDKGDRTIVAAPFVGSPADKAGLRPGDSILQVNDKKTDHMNMTQVVDLIKGPRGTQVQLGIGRDGVAQMLTFNITRQDISNPSVSDAFWLRPGIAYVQVKNFSDENTSTELQTQLKKLGQDNIKGLVLDLRTNPGGLLNEGIDVAGQFLKKGQLVVSHRGRTQPSKSFTAHTDNGGHEYPMVVVVNRNTASAAEIVSGALQDHDRALILGETTFGKGLVQTVFPLSENTALALTTMHYYTPSGRLIQRDYSHESFLDYYYNNNRNEKNLADVKMTDSGRTVYGGGGITPDEKYDYPRANKFQIAVRRKDAFFNFSSKFFGPRPDVKLPKGWEPDETVVNDFHQFLLDNGVEFTEADFTTNHQWMKDQLKRQMYVTAFGVDASDRVGIEQDPEIAKAADAMPRAQALLDSAKKMLVQRITQQNQAQ